ncbi:MAG: histidine phosphatase family protein [Ruminococcaceae bacterium]|nr:histidine phosphatase family protein [Oscillospiraceae bacterium]MBR3595769.1 histidine phosphatase family protein [Clostridia bacterium]
MSLNKKDFIISFVRHAESCGNAGIHYENEYQEDDPPLSPHGLLQAEKLAQSSYTDDITKIYSSTLLRTVQTAYPTAVKLTKEIILLPDLMEIGTEISGTELWRLKNDYPLAVPCISEPTPCGGKLLLGDESYEEKIARGRRCTDYFYSEARDGDHFMVVSHGSYFGYLIRAALNITLPESFCWQVDNCSMTRIIFRKDNIPKLSFANSINHLI